MAGTEMLPEEAKVTVPPKASGALRVTVQEVTAAGASEVALQDNPLSTGAMGAAPVAELPVVLSAIRLPSRLAPRPPERPIAADVAPGARVTATVATLPFEITLALMPVAMHIYAAGTPPQVRVLPAADKAAPGITTKLVTAASG